MNLDDNQLMDAVRGAVADVHMSATADDIQRASRAQRARRRQAGVAGGLATAAAAAVVVAIGANGSTPAPAPTTAPPTTLGGLHIRTAAYTLQSLPGGAVQLTWDKQRYFSDHVALEAALKQVGMPVDIRVGEFCAGPNDDTSLDPSGVGPGVDQVMSGESSTDGRVVFNFKPSAMPAGKELFIGYLNPAQLAITQGNPGSVERLVSTGAPLVCTSTPPPANPNIANSGPTPRG